MNKGKKQKKEGIELFNQESSKTFEEKENYKYLEILLGDTIKEK